MMFNVILALIYVLCEIFMLIPSVSAGVFISINCGATGTLKKNSIQWMGDDTFIETGESYEAYIPPSEVLGTLRVFPTGKKNCYSINVDQGERILVRASFYYGNYDGSLSPPAFDLQFDGNHWATVNASTTDVVSQEAIYTVKQNSTSVCLAQSFPDQLPFINSLEVRSLETSVYSHVGSNHALFLAARAAAASNSTPIRYPDDKYDRIWVPALGSWFNFGLTAVKSEADSVGVNVGDLPPEIVMETAVTTTGGLFSQITLTNIGLTETELPIYMTTYFSEVMKLSSAQKRSFQMYVNDKPGTTSIVPTYGSTLEVYLGDMTASSNTNFTLKPTPDSTLPPLINAFELYTISDPLTNGTNSIDVEGLLALQSKFTVLERWKGDPCLPSPYSWDWITCNTDTTPRVIGLQLNDFGLSGELPDFSALYALQTIDVHNNSLEGPIPDFLGTLPNLQLLNLAENRFNGTMPASLTDNKELKLNVTGNCLSGMTCKKSDSTPAQDPPPSQMEYPVLENSQMKSLGQPISSVVHYS